MAKSQKCYVEQEKLDITQYILYNFADVKFKDREKLIYNDRKKNGDRKNWKGNALSFDWDSGFVRKYIC